MSPRRRPAVPLLLSAVLAVGLSSLTACGADDDPGPVAAGAVVVGGPVSAFDTGSDLDAEPLEAFLPSARLDVRLVASRTLPDEPFDVSSLGTVVPRPPTGGSWVLVQVTTSSYTDGRGAPASSAPVLADVALTTSGSSYPLPTVAADLTGSVEFSRFYAVAVDDGASDAALTITLEGRTQTLRVDGSSSLDAADRFGAAPLVEDAGCGGLRAPRATTDVRQYPADCELTARLTPYVAGLGWAEDDRAFLVVSTTASPASFVRPPGSPATDIVEAGAPQVLVDGEEPLRSDAGVDDLGGAAEAIFEVEPGASAGVRLQVLVPGRADNRSLTWTWTQRLDVPAEATR